MLPVFYGWLSLTPIEHYHFVDQQKQAVRLSGQFEPPLGYKRVPVAEGSFGAWLRDLPLSSDLKVKTHRGQPIAAPSAAVVDLDVGKGNLQQCADSILRLYAEYRWTIDKGAGLGFHFSSGDFSSWSKWRGSPQVQRYRNIP